MIRLIQDLRWALGMRDELRAGMLAKQELQFVDADLHMHFAHAVPQQ